MQRGKSLLFRALAIRASTSERTTPPSSSSQEFAINERHCTRARARIAVLIFQRSGSFAHSRARARALKAVH